MPFFSVIIPTYNRLALLRRTLESVWAQHFTDFEVIVIDDGSIDGTGEWLAMHGGRARVFTQANHGPSAARNRGASHARGEYLAFLDSDDTWFPWTLAIYKEAIARWDRPSFVAGRDAESAECVMVQPRQFKARQYADYFSTASESVWILPSAAVVRTSPLLEVGGFTENLRFAEDSDLWLRLGNAPGFVQVMDPAVVRYQRHTTGNSLVSQYTPGAIETLIAREKTGRYPGSEMRMRERRAIISRHVRPAALEYLRHGKKKEAWELYRATFRWNLQLRRWKFLAGFPLRACFVR